MFGLLFVVPLAMLSLYLIYRWRPISWEDSNSTVNDWELDTLINYIKIAVIVVFWLVYFETF